MGKSLITGIDIGHHSIKAVVLKSMGGRYALMSYQELPITDGIVADNHTLNYQKIVKKLNELRKGLPLFSRQVAISIPDNAVISKVLQIDSELQDRELEFALYQAFSQQSPFPIEEVSLDFIKLDDKHRLKAGTLPASIDSASRTPRTSPHASTSHASMTSYQVYATRKEVVASRAEVVLKAGMTPYVVDVQAHSLLQVWQLLAHQHPDKKNWMLVDVGLTQISLCSIPEGKSPFHKDIAYGTRHAKSLDDNPSLDAASDHNVDRFFQEVFERIRRQLQLYASVNNQKTVEGIWLSGGGANIPMLSEHLSRELSLDCETLNLFSLFEDKTSKRKVLRADSQVYSTAAGLAVSGIQWMEAAHVRQ